MNDDNDAYRWVRIGAHWHPYWSGYRLGELTAWHSVGGGVIQTIEEWGPIAVGPDGKKATQSIGNDY